MERKHYSFEGYGSPKKLYTFEGCGTPEIQGVTIYQKRLSESDALILAIGIRIGLRHYCKDASVTVYEEDEQEDDEQ